MRARTAIFFPLVVLTACSLPGSQIHTADDLAQALEKGGLAFTERSRANLSQFRHARIDEGLELRGDGIAVDILRITDRRTWNVYSDGVAFLGIAEAAAGTSFPGKPDVVVRRPFIVIVREEPVAGRVRGIVERLVKESS